MVKYKIVDQESVRVVTAFVDGELYVADSSHPNFDEIVEALIDGDIDVRLFDIATSVAEAFEAVSERVSIRGGSVYFDGDLVDNSLTQQIIRFLNEGEDFTPLVNFFEKVAQNPEEHSREQLYKFLSKHAFTITDDGDFIAYKGVAPTEEDGVYQSIHSGAAIVNGQPVEGRVKQSVYDVVEMPRSKVTHDPAEPCSFGLHAGTRSYAQTYGSVLLTVEINPRDVVSVPHDAQDQKIRCCRYVVIDVDAPEQVSARYVASQTLTPNQVRENMGVRQCDNGDGNKHHAKGLCRKCYGAKYKR